MGKAVFGAGIFQFGPGILGLMYALMPSAFSAEYSVACQQAGGKYAGIGSVCTCSDGQVINPYVDRCEHPSAEALAANRARRDTVAAQILSAGGPTRWCGVGGHTQNVYRPANQTVTCDGFNTSGQIDLGAKVQRISVDVWDSWGSKGRNAVIEIPGLTAGQLANILNPPLSDKVRLAVEGYLKQNKLAPLKDEAALNIQSIEVSANEPIYNDEEETKLLAPMGNPAPLKVGAQALYKNELGCLAAWSRVPGFDKRIVVSSGDSDHHPIAFIQAAGSPGDRRDIIITPDGFYSEKYGKKFGSTARYYSVAAGRRLTYVEHDYEDIDPNDTSDTLRSGTSEPTLSFKPRDYQGRTPLTTLSKSDLTILKGHPEEKFIYSAVIEASRTFRSEFDRDARYRSKASLNLVSDALDKCLGISELNPKDPTKSELSYFEHHVFPKGRKQSGDAGVTSSSTGETAAAASAQ